MQEFVVCKMSESTLNWFCVSSVWCYKWACVTQRSVCESLLVGNVNGVAGGAVLALF